MIFCQYLKKQSLGLERAPFNNIVGEYLFENICQEAWDLWKIEQIKIINENRLSLQNLKTREFLREKMMIYFDIQSKFID